MDCLKIKEIIPSYIIHCATDEDILAVEEHLCICEDCRHYLSNQMEKPRKVFAQVPTKEIPPKANTIEYVILSLGAVIFIGLLILLFSNG